MSRPEASPRESGAESSLGPVLDFMRLLWTIDHALQRASKRMARTLGVTGPQRLVIRIVGRFPGISAGRLSGILHSHPSTLTGILHRLAEAGLVRRSSDPRDRRRAVLRLTPRGRAVARKTWGTVEGALRRTLRDVSQADLSRAGAVLGDLARELNRRWPQAGPPATAEVRRRGRKMPRAAFSD